jgi:hypothetical protein
MRGVRGIVRAARAGSIPIRISKSQGADRHCERSEAIHLAAQRKKVWIASSLRSSQ